MHAFLMLGLLSIVSGSVGQPERKPLGEIEFFGYKGLNLELVRAALPLREGEMFPPENGSSEEVKRIIGERVRQAIGRGPTDIAAVCCDNRQQWMIYIGLPGASSKPVAYNPAPRGDVRFPADVLKLRDEIDAAWMTSVMSGNAREDDSQGFALSFDPVLRAKQMELRQYALGNEATILDVLETSSDAVHRAIAATALGYARSSNRQIDALVHACLDPDDGVRNDAVRALGVLASGRPSVAGRIPGGHFIPLLASNVWTDRNKGALLLLYLTKRRDKRLLKQLREDALDTLIEMARWRSPGHAESALNILGRIAGIEESRLQHLIEQGQTGEIINAVSRRD